MSTDVINRPLFKALTRLGATADEAVDAASGFVVPAELEKLATKDDLKLLETRLTDSMKLLETRLTDSMKLLESRLTVRIVLFVGGALVVLTQVVPPGKLFQLISGLVGHLTG